MQTEDQTTVVLGAGASRGVSYSATADVQSPLDSDFFDLLRRLDPHEFDRDAVEFVLKEFPRIHRESMERSFYTAHVDAEMQLLLKVPAAFDSKMVAKNFARAIQALLRAAHKQNKCDFHTYILEGMLARDTVISFNYDLVVERALQNRALELRAAFGSWLYGLEKPPSSLPQLPMVLKLHGSSNWKALKSPRLQFSPRQKTWQDFDGMPGYRRHGSGEADDFPLLLPFWNKAIEKNPWLTVWKRAFTRLKGTKLLFVWGYSLPATDLKARKLFELALSKESDRLTLCVVDPSPITRKVWRGICPEAKYWEYETIESFLESPPRWWWGPRLDYRRIVNFNYKDPE